MVMRRLLIAAAILALGSCSEGGDKVSAATPQGTARLHAIDRSHAGTPAPAVAFETKDGKSATLADFRGRRVLVNLWATWCVPCIAEMPDLDALAKAKGTALIVLPVSQDMEGWRAVTPFFAKRGFSALVPRLDQPGNFAEAVKARGLPVSILYDAQGREVWRVAGSVKWTSAEVMAAL